MKKLSTFCLSAILALFVQGEAAADPSKNTAVYVKAHILDLSDKEVSIDVSYVVPMVKVESEKYGFIVAKTWDDKENVSGGDILVVVPRAELTKTLDRYGVSPDIEKKGRLKRDVDTHRLTGILRTTEKKRPFIDAAGGKVEETDLPKLPEVAGKPAAPKKPGPDKKPGKKPGKVKKPGKGK